METFKIKNSSNADLILRFGKLVQTERKITQAVLECIVEIDRRKLYLEKAYPSLFEFLVKEFGYSPSAAMRRIESARLMGEIPEISEKIQTGSLNLSQLSKVQQTIRTVQKTDGNKVALSQKIEILKKIENTTHANTELILAQEFNLPTVSFDKEKINRDESVTLTITLTKAQMEILEKAQNLISHIVPDKKWSAVFTHLASKEIERRSPKEKKKSSVESAERLPLEDRTVKPTSLAHSKAQGNLLAYSKVSNTPLTISQVEQTLQLTVESEVVKKAKHISIHTRKEVLDQKQASCQFHDPVTQKTCGSQRFLQIDHIQPKWAKGSNEVINFQVLCAQHNQYRYKKQSNLLPIRLTIPHKY